MPDEIDIAIRVAVLIVLSLFIACSLRQPDPAVNRAIMSAPIAAARVVGTTKCSSKEK